MSTAHRRRHRGRRHLPPRDARLARGQLPAPRCASPCTSEDDVCWGGAALQVHSPTRSASGWSAWPSAAGPCRPGRASTAAAACRKRRGQGAARGDGARSKCRSPLQSFGIWMLGPALLKFGSEAAEARAPAEDRARRDPLVPGLFRAERRLRPGRAGDARRGPRRPLRRQRPEDLDQRTPTRPTGSSAWCAPTARRRSTPASASCCSTWRRRASAPGRSS